MYESSENIADAKYSSTNQGETVSSYQYLISHTHCGYENYFDSERNIPYDESNGTVCVQ